MMDQLLNISHARNISAVNAIKIIMSFTLSADYPIFLAKSVADGW
jgi:uncharacterized protein YoaH (UPF0181 family)